MNERPSGGPFASAKHWLTRWRARRRDAAVPEDRRASLDEIFEEHHGLVWGMLLREGIQPAHAEAMLQDAFVTLHGQTAKGEIRNASALLQGTSHDRRTGSGARIRHRPARRNLAARRNLGADRRVGAKRVIWHVGFERNIRRRGSRAFEILSEFLLSREPPRIDYLFLRKIAELLLDDTAQTLRRLWPMLPRVSVVEYKSPSRPYRKGNLDRLWSYIHTYYADQQERSRERADGTRLTPGMEGAPDVWVRADLCAVLVVPARTPSLLADAEEQGLAWVDRGDGYWEVTGGKFALYVLEIDVIGPAEGDDLLHSLGHGKPLTPEARSFWIEFVGSKEAGMSTQDMEGYDELMTRLLEALPPAQVMAHYAPEQRLAGLAPEQRLAGLDRDHQALALPVELLRVLPDEYVRSLAPEVQAEIQRRLQLDTH